MSEGTLFLGHVFAYPSLGAACEAQCRVLCRLYLPLLSLYLLGLVNYFHV